MPGEEKQYDVVIYGATGFTGKLVAEYYLERYLGDYKFAIAGRNEKKLEEVRESLIRSCKRKVDTEQLPLIIANSNDPTSLESMVKLTKVVVSTTGPYLKYGFPLVELCAKNGVNYCDITGEPVFVRKCVDEYGKIAESNKALIVHCCGYDSVPTDMGTYMMASEFKKQYGELASYIACGVGVTKGGPSGGTLATVVSAFESPIADQKVANNPYCLMADHSDQTTKRGFDYVLPYFNKELKSVCAYFGMTIINSRIVWRSVSKRSDVYPENFEFDESLMMGTGIFGLIKAVIYSVVMLLGVLALAFPLTRKLIQNYILPMIGLAPGGGPSRKTMENGEFAMKLVARNSDHSKTLNGEVKGFLDPGYMGTARMLGEAGIALTDQDILPGKEGGVLTPASGLGDPYLERLRNVGCFEYNIITKK